MQATECDYLCAKNALDKAGNNTKLATFMVLTGLDLPEAKASLLQNKGFLRKAVEQLEQSK
jgi:N-acetylmuramic acid 6-phosphate etherase